MQCLTYLAALVLLVSAATAVSLPRVLPVAAGEEGVIVHGACEFRVNGDLNDPAPLFARHNSYEIIVPDPTDTVRLANGELLDMYCTHGFAAPFEQRQQLTAQCVQQKYFLVDGLIYPFGNFSCAAWPTYTARRTGRPCNGGTDLVEVGFEVQDGGFLHAYDVCHDELAEATRYVHHVLHPSSYDYQHGVQRPSFLGLDFYGGRDVNARYTQVQQNITISGILGLDASPYFNYSDDRILSRGHMIAKTDQIFGAMQMSTFLYINVAPQWQTFNGGNWERVETSVRKFVADQNLTTDCYTGTWGVSTLPDVHGVPQELYLDFDENNNGLIPVPRLYFRVVLDRASHKGIVLVGVNNPYASLAEIQRDYIVCEDIGHKLKWLTWLKEDLHEGYSYACTVEDFTAVVKDLPLEDLHANGVLGIDEDEQSTSTEASSSTSELTTLTTEEDTTTSSSSSSTTESTTLSTTASSSTSEDTTLTTEEDTTTSSSSSSTTEQTTTTESTTLSTTASSSTSEDTTTTVTTAETTTSPASTATPPTPTPTVPQPSLCHFNINDDLNDPAPLLTPTVRPLSWLLPDQSGRYTLVEGEALELHCTGALKAPFNRYTALTAQCMGNQRYQTEGQVVEITAFSCNYWPIYEARRIDHSCPGGVQLVQIGFDVAAGFMPLLELCYDESTLSTRYVRYELSASNVAYQQNVAQPGFKRGDFYTGKDVNLLYAESHQLQIFSETLGLDASQYFDEAKDLYLMRGQLAPRHDFVHGSAQRATHFYVNAVPQWRSISIGNWLRIERSLRDFVASQALNVSVHAGSWEVATLPNGVGEQTPLYLDYDAADEGLLPVPLLLYRIVIDQTSLKGIALVVVNNPHATLAEILKDYVICEDVGDSIDWIDWHKTELHSGYAYACDVADFTAVVQNLPLEQLNTTGLLGVSEQPAQSSCSFRVNGDLLDPAPLFVMRNEQGEPRWLEPNVEGVVQLQSGQSFEMHCTGGFLSPFDEHKQLEVSCLAEHSFVVEGNVHNFTDFVCRAWPAYDARRTGRPCNGGTELAEVGFELADSSFLQIFDACHDELEEATRYVHHVLTPASAQYQRSVSRPSFITGDFYAGKDVNTMYTQKQQQLTVAEILGDAEYSSQYFNISSDLYMARGHLAAKTDFIFGAPQKATFYFINAAPQWQCFNGGNWERVEDSVRKFVASEGITVDCYTGSWGVSTLPDVNGAPQQLYLGFDENNNGLIPVPRLYFRVIVDRASLKGLVLIGVNNPHIGLPEIEREYVICKDISDQLTWVSWAKDNLYKGYSYACTVPDFIAVVKQLPLEQLELVTGVLGI